MAVWELIEELTESAKSALDEKVTLEERDDIPQLDTIKLEVPRWYRVDDVVAVLADLRGSTNFNTGRNEKTIARFYEAYMGQLVACVDEFDPAFIDIQGDGLFALFDGGDRYRAAMVAGITMKTWVQLRLLDVLKKKVTELPETGLKVGVASGAVFVKRVGIRGERNEPIWAGRPVNWAAKCAQVADAGELIVTPKVWSKIETNDYLTWSCGCNPPSNPLFSDVTVEKLPEEHQTCKKLSSNWCPNCGDAFSEAILAGKTKRDLS